MVWVKEVLAFNTYSDDTDFELTSSYNTSVSTKKYVDFTALLNESDDDATVYQYYDSSNANSVGLISGSTELDEYAFTLQAEFIFPNKDEQDQLSYICSGSCEFFSVWFPHTKRYKSKPQQI